MQIEKPIDIYNKKIIPKIKEIDIFLKTNTILDKDKTAKILDITQEELNNILDRLNIKNIDTNNFIAIMLNGSSFICKLLKREIECGSPYFYTPKDLSYIYQLDYDKVYKAFSFLELKTITTAQIPTILIQI